MKEDFVLRDSLSASISYQNEGISSLLLLERLDYFSPKLRTNNRRLLFSVLFAVFLALLPAAGIFKLFPETLLGLPTPILWISACALLLCSLSFIGFYIVFRAWSEEIDNQVQITVQGDMP